MSLKFSEKTVTVEEKTLHGSICELENAVLREAKAGGSISYPPGQDQQPVAG